MAKQSPRDTWWRSKITLASRSSKSLDEHDGCTPRCSCACGCRYSLPDECRGASRIARLGDSCHVARTWGDHRRTAAGAALRVDAVLGRLPSTCHAGWGLVEGHGARASERDGTRVRTPEQGGELSRNRILPASGHTATDERGGGGTCSWGVIDAFGTHALWRWLWRSCCCRLWSRRIRFRMRLPRRLPRTIRPSFGHSCCCHCFP